MYQVHLAREGRYLRERLAPARKDGEDDGKAAHIRGVKEINQITEDAALPRRVASSSCSRLEPGKRAALGFDRRRRWKPERSVVVSAAQRGGRRAIQA